MQDTSESDNVPEANDPQPPDGASASTGAGKSAWRPADYYATPPGKPRFPRWVPISCGVAALVALVFMVAIGLFLQSGGLGSFIALAIGQFQSEANRMIADDVPTEMKEELDATLKDVRERLTSGKLDQADALPLLQEMQKVAKDKKVTSEEVERLLSLAGGLSGPDVGGDQPSSDI